MLTATSARATGKRNVGTRVNCEAVILVVHDGARYQDVLGRANIKGIRVVAKLALVTGRVIVCHINDIEVGSRVDAHELDWRILDVQALDAGLLQGVGIEELGLGLATVGPLSIPPLGAVAINDVARGTGDGDVSSGDLSVTLVLLRILKCCILEYFKT
jgi:hypothetical protein